MEHTHLCNKNICEINEDHNKALNQPDHIPQCNSNHNSYKLLADRKSTQQASNPNKLKEISRIKDQPKK